MSFETANESHLLCNMTALVRCSEEHISAGPPHREAAFRGHLRQRSKRSLTCLTLGKKKKTKEVLQCFVYWPKIQTPFREPTTIHKEMRSSDLFDLQSHQVVTTLHWWIYALQFCIHRIVQHWTNKHKLLIVKSKLKHKRQPCHDLNCNSTAFNHSLKSNMLHHD